MINQDITSVRILCSTFEATRTYRGCVEIPKWTQMEPKWTQMDPNGTQMDPNENQMDPNGNQMDPNGT